MFIYIYICSPSYCRENLRKYTTKKQYKNYHIFALGCFIGYVTVFLLIIVYMRVDGKIDPTINYDKNDDK